MKGGMLERTPLRAQVPTQRIFRCLGARKRDADEGAPSCGGLRRTDLALGLQDLESPLVPAPCTALPGAADHPHDTHQGEDEPPVVAEELEQLFHAIMLTAVPPAGYGGEAGRRAQPNSSARTVAPPPTRISETMTTHATILMRRCRVSL